MAAFFSLSIYFSFISRNLSLKVTAKLGEEDYKVVIDSLPPSRELYVAPVVTRKPLR
jgi:hypothetical protein